MLFGKKFVFLIAEEYLLKLLRLSICLLVLGLFVSCPGVEPSAINSDCDMLTFNFDSLSAEGEISGYDISVSVPYGTDVTNLTPSFTTNGKAVIVGDVIQVSGSNSHDFSSSIVYRVVALDWTIVEYTVTVSITPPSSDNEIVSFNIDALSVIGEISGTNITLNISEDESVVSLVASFITAGVSITVGGVDQVSGVTINDFSSPVDYIVTSESGDAETYTVTVNILSNDCDITAFSFETLSVDGHISGTDIVVELPMGTDLSDLVATFTSNGDNISISGIEQASGITSNDFSNEVVYLVTAEDGTSKEFSVICHIDDNIIFMAANLTSGNFQSYEDAGIRIINSIKPDVVFVQEFSYQSGSLRDLVDAALGTEYEYSVGSGIVPNGIISKYPILDSGYWDDPNISNRDLDWAIIDIPGVKNLFVVSVNLSTTSSYQVDAAKIIASNIETHKLSYPGQFYYAVGGTFNGTGAVSDAGIDFYDDFDILDPYPVGKNGDSGTNASRTSIYDFVVFGTDLSQLEAPFFQNSSASYSNGFIFDTRLYTQAELDVSFAPALVADSDASNMQHMAVVKKVNLE